MKLLAALSISVMLWCCSASRQATPKQVGTVSLNNYKLIDTVQLPEAINYRYYSNEQQFNRNFHMTRATMETAIVPDFNAQRVVAIMMQPTDKVMTLEIRKAAMSGDELFVYFNIVDTVTTWKAAYAQPVIALATVPKSENIRKVSFYHNQVKEFTLNLPE